VLERQQALAALHQEMLACRRCALAGYHVEGTPVLGGTPDMLAGARRVMLIGQAPGRVEAGNGRPFSGPAGKRLFGWLAGAGIAEDAFRRQVYMAAMTRCYPGASPTGHGDRRPSAQELAFCRRFLDRQIDLIGPELVLLVGGLAIEAFLGKLKLDAAVGRFHERDALRYLALPHPSGASTWLNDPSHQALLRRSLDLLCASGLILPTTGSALGLPQSHGENAWTTDFGLRTQDSGLRT
jgi:uracil-DNA glycosylase family 4